MGTSNASATARAVSTMSKLRSVNSIPPYGFAPFRRSRGWSSAPSAAFGTVAPSETAASLSRLYLPVSNPPPKGLHGIMPRPNSRAIGRMSSSTPRSTRDQAYCRPIGPGRPWARASVAILATYHDGALEKP